jgi:hypothetical protein
MATKRWWTVVCVGTLLAAQDPALPPLSPVPAPGTAHESPAELLVKLRDPSSREWAHERLLAAGAAAVPALVANLADENDVVPAQRLVILHELGPAAGAAVPALIELLLQGTPWQLEVTRTLAELVPWRAPELAYDDDAMARAFSRDSTGRPRTIGPGLGERLLQHRLRVRATFPRDADVATLVTIVRRGQPWRRELAIELLGRRGAEAAEALPALRDVLERPEPRILTTRTDVPLHRVAARAALAIGADGDLAARARDVSADRPVPLPVPPPPPERLQRRLAELVQQLGVPDQRAAASANLLALGELAAAPLGALLTTADDATIGAALVVLCELGPRAAAAVPDLILAAASSTTAHTGAVLRALAVAAPHAHDLVPPLDWQADLSEVTVFGKRLRGPIDAALLNALSRAQRALAQHQIVDPTATVAELGAFLAAPRVETREAALVLIAARGEPARPLLPALAAMLRAGQPASQEVVWHERGARVQAFDRTVPVQRLAARAILAIAPPDDPRRAAAQAVLAAEPAAK